MLYYRLDGFDYCYCMLVTFIISIVVFGTRAYSRPGKPGKLTLDQENGENPGKLTMTRKIKNGQENDQEYSKIARKTRKILF